METSYALVCIDRRRLIIKEIQEAEEGGKNLYRSRHLGNINYRKP